MARRLIATALACVTVTVVTGCASGASAGRFTDPTDQAGPVLDQALDDLAGQPLLAFTGTVTAFDAAGTEATELDAIGTVDGDLYGSLVLGGHDAELMAVDGHYYVKATTGYWKEQDQSSSVAEKLAGGWTPVDPAGWFAAPTVLTGLGYGAALRTALDGARALDSWLPEPLEANGSGDYPIPVGEGIVHVSATEPHRVTAVTEVPVRDDKDAAARLSVAPVAVDDPRVTDWAEDFHDAVADLSTVYHVSSGVGMSMSTSNFVCYANKCTIFATLDSSGMQEYESIAKKVTLRFTGVGESDFGTEKCVAKTTVKIGDSDIAQCDLTFNVGPGQSGSVTPTWKSDGLVSFRPDTDGIDETLTEHLAALAG